MTSSAETAKPRSLAWNGFWTIAMSSSTGLLAVILPPFLTRLLTHEEYGAWALSLQVASYVLVLAFGLQGAVGRFVALAVGADGEARGETVVAAFHMACVAALAGAGLVLAAAGVVPYFVTDMSPELVGDFRSALVLCGAAAGLSLTSTPFVGAFLGEQRAHVPALIILLGRALQCALLVFAALRYRDIAALAVAYFVGQALIVIAQLMAWRSLSSATGKLWRHIARDHYRKLWRFCTPFVLWNLLAALSFGSDLIIVSKLDFAAMPFYAVSLTIATTFVGFLAAGYNSMLPAAARLVGGGDRVALLEMMLRGGRLGVGLSVAIGVPLMLAPTWLLGAWVGASYAASAAPFVALLILAQIVRLAMSMYGSVTIAAGLHRTVILAPVLDAAVGLLLAIILGLWLGAIGVAIGMVGGALANLLTWYWKDPLREVFALRKVAPLFLKSCLLPITVAALGVAVIEIWTSAGGGAADAGARFAAALAIGVSVGVVAFRKPSSLVVPAAQPRVG